MQNRTLNAIFLIAVCALSTGAGAQNTYKCGSSYSQLPCAGGVVIDTADRRTLGQKTQADMATDRNARTADQMEKARLKQEKIDIEASMTPWSPANTETVNTPETTQAKKKKKEPEYFVAQAAGEKKAMKTTTKSAKKTRVSKSRTD
jgi:hypothetical protein